MKDLKSLLELALSIEGKPLSEQTLNELTASYALRLLTSKRLRRSQHLGLVLVKDSNGYKAAILWRDGNPHDVRVIENEAYRLALRYLNRYHKQATKINLSDLLAQM